MASSVTGSVGGAIDVQGIVSQLMSIERQPLQKLQTTASGIQTKLSAIGRVQGAVSSFQSAAQELINLPSWRAVQATSSNESAVKATASTGAVAGTYDLTVNQLAQRQTLASDAKRERGLNGPTVASADELVGSGTLAIARGTYNMAASPPTFTGTPFNVAIAATDTLTQVRDKINAAGAGVTASIETVGSQVRLALRSTDPNDTRAFQILATDSDGNHTDTSGLSVLAYDEIKAAGAGRNMALRNDEEWVIGGGTLNIAKTGTAPVSVVIDANSTLAQARDKINAASAGVTATIVNDTNGARLVLRSTGTGAAGAATITVSSEQTGGGTLTDTNGLSMLAYDPLAPVGNGRNLTQTQAAQDASVTISGITVTSATNTVTGAIENVSLDLRQAGVGNLSITVTTDSSSMRSMLDKFVASWNDLNRIIGDVTRFDPSTKVAGPLQGDNTVLGLQRQLRATLTATVGDAQATLGDGQVRRLADAGLTLQRDGSLQINAAKLSPLLSTPAQLSNLFAASDNVNPSLNGIGRRLATLASGMLASDGAVSASSSALRSRQTSVQQQQERLQTRLSMTEQRLLRQYSAVNDNIARINSGAGAVVSRFG